MIEYDRIEVSEGINVNKTSKSKESDFAAIGIFLSKGFQFQRYVCNRYHYLLTMSMNFHDITFLKIKCF